MSGTINKTSTEKTFHKKWSDRYLFLYRQKNGRHQFLQSLSIFLNQLNETRTQVNLSPIYSWRGGTLLNENLQIFRSPHSLTDPINYRQMPFLFLAIPETKFLPKHFKMTLGSQRRKHVYREPSNKIFYRDLERTPGVLFMSHQTLLY